ncbi:MAG: hypothetical protein QM783_02720 [Phycisphaerales bacterium]
MRVSQLFVFAVAAVAAVAASCAKPAPKVSTSADVPQANAMTTTAAGPFDVDVLRVVAAFQAWPRLTRTPGIAPTLCIMWPPNFTAKAHISQSGDDSTHGQKLYHLYAMDSKSYFEQTDMFGGWEPGKNDPKPMEGFEQVLVKDSFVPVPAEEVRPGDPKQKETDAEDLAYGGQGRYTAGAPKGQFIMIKYADAAKPGTDQGWVYATVSPDGAIVQSGMVESCMDCHTRAPHGRLFGISSRESEFGGRKLPLDLSNPK